MGDKLSDEFISTLNKAVEIKENINLLAENDKNSDVIIIGESVISMSLAKALKDECGISSNVICPVDTERSFGAVFAEDEDDIIPQIKDAELIIADPLYRPICPKDAKFVDLPHFAFSGRIWKNEVPNFLTDFTELKDKILHAIN